MFVTQTTDKPSKSPIETLGGKGFNLFRMVNTGLPVPPAFIIPTKACVRYMEDPVAVMAHVASNVVPDIIKYHGFTKGELVSVRSGAKMSMPGMMDTILNVGITPDTLNHLINAKGARTAYDSLRRLVQMYGGVVDSIPHENFEHILTQAREAYGVKLDSEFTADQLLEICKSFFDQYQVATGKPFPQTIEEQLTGAIEAVFRSWNNERAVFYREKNGISHNMGTAVVVQRMVFGNANDKSCTGVLFTRDPSTGAKGVVGEFLVNAQGEDVVAGIRTPEPLEKMALWDETLYGQLCLYADSMEEVNRDMQDMEFTVEDGKLYFLQTRNGKRMADAAINIAYDMCQEGYFDAPTALGKISYSQFVTASRPQIPASFKDAPHGTGIPASTGVVKGVAVFTSEDAVKCNQPCILVSKETTPDDIAGMYAAVGILTSTGGSTSHAAVVARGMDKVCIVGCADLHLKSGDVVTLGGVTVTAGKTVLCLDGGTGRIWVDTDVPVVGGATSPTVGKLVDLVSKVKDVNVIIPLAQVVDIGPTTAASMVFLDDADLDKELPDLLKKALANGWKKFVYQSRAAVFGTYLDARFQSKEVAGWVSNLLYPILQNPEAVLFVDTPHTDTAKALTGKKAAVFDLASPALGLEGLVLAPTGSEVVLPATPSPAVAKVLAWRKAAGDELTPVTVGALADAGRSYLGITALMRLVLS